MIPQRIIGFLFLMAFCTKLLGQSEFRTTIRETFGIRDRWQILSLVILVLGAEFLVGTALLLGLLIPWANVGSAILLASFTGAMVLARRPMGSSTCGCFGAWKALDSDGGRALVLRNVGFALWALSTLAKETALFFPIVAGGAVLIAAAFALSGRLVQPSASTSDLG